MSTQEQTSILQALAEEPRTMQRQMLLKKLWKLKRQTADNSKDLTPTGKTADRAAKPAQ